MGKEADGHEKWICCVVMSLINEAGAAGMGDTGTEALRFWYRGSQVCRLVKKGGMSC